VTTTVAEQAWGELLRGDKVIYNVKLDLIVKELMVDESPMPVDRAIARIALSRMSGITVEDGDYTLRFNFNGRQEEHSVRVEGGTLLSGRAA
jgi:hypothetical protein